MKLNEAEPNRQVKYTPRENCTESEIEYGVLTTVGTKYVFVRYGSEVQSKATPPEKLEYV